MNYQWYPGHMTKAKRMMQENIKLIDLVIELTDARVPLSSRNPDIDTLGAHKARLLVLNKADLAAEGANQRWLARYSDDGMLSVAVNARSGQGLKKIQAAIQEACREKIARDRKRGILNRPVRAMVVGIPNVGKSTFINALAGKAVTKTGNKPGVTRGKQWIRLNRQVELLDTPGLLWPKFDDERVGQNLALVGAIKDEVLPAEELALVLISRLCAHYPAVLSDKYACATADADFTVLEAVARSRQCVTKGGNFDTVKAARLLLEDFRSGRLGRITLELPAEI